MQSMRLLWGSILALLMCAALSLAQTGSIQGTVTDSVGAVVQGAEITVKNLGSNAVRTVTSSGTGAFSIPSLPPGNYDVTVKMASFKTFHVSDLPSRSARCSAKRSTGAGRSHGRSSGSSRPDSRR